MDEYWKFSRRLYIIVSQYIFWWIGESVQGSPLSSFSFWGVTMKKAFSIFLGFLLLAFPAYLLFANTHVNFLSAGIAVNATVTKVNGTDFTSTEIFLGEYRTKDVAAIKITFTRTAGSASTVDFEFQVSLDGKTNWTTAYFVKVSSATNETAVSNAVRKVDLVNVYGVTHIRLYRIVNNDAANNLTAVNASISF